MASSSRSKRARVRAPLGKLGETRINVKSQRVRDLRRYYNSGITDDLADCDFRSSTVKIKSEK